MSATPRTDKAQVDLHEVILTEHIGERTQYVQLYVAAKLAREIEIDLTAAEAELAAAKETIAGLEGQNATLLKACQRIRWHRG